MPLPEFVGIGVQRAGTTWIHQGLSEHPEICTPEQKEIHFFDWYWDRGVDWYQEYFTHCDPRAVVGEITPDYIYDPQAIKRMAKTVPNAKLFVILRDPVDRAYSAYWLFKDRRYAGLTFEKALEQDPELIDRGIYADQLETLYEYYPEGQVLVLFYNALDDDDLGTIQRIYRFISVDSAFEPTAAGQSHNAVIFPRMQSFLRRTRLTWTKDLVKTVGLDKPVRRWHRARAGSHYPPMEPATRDELRAHFAPHNRRLSRVLDQELPWSDEPTTPKVDATSTRGTSSPANGDQPD